jgi:hypothetical protein
VWVESALANVIIANLEDESVAYDAATSAPMQPSILFPCKSLHRVVS